MTPLETMFGTMKDTLDNLYQTYDERYLSSDPLLFVHRYSDPRDQEIVGLIASSLAYGNVKSIIADVGDVLERIGPEPFRFVEGFDPSRDSEVFDGFYHRFNKGVDLALLCLMMQSLIVEYGSLGRGFSAGYFGETSIGPALERFVERLLSTDSSPILGEPLPKKHAARYFLPSPRAGSACKRLNLYLRWMIRRNDGVDMGLWTDVPPSALVMPLDTHTARLARYIGLTDRKSTDWKMAVEVTERLKELDPDDPVKYDFALCRLGILDKCPAKRDVVLCKECMIRDICTL